MTIFCDPRTCNPREEISEKFHIDICNVHQMYYLFEWKTELAAPLVVPQKQWEITDLQLPVMKFRRNLMLLCVMYIYNNALLNESQNYKALT
jgi:hypothetical protein